MELDQAHKLQTNKTQISDDDAAVKNPLHDENISEKYSLAVSV
jgi:hypothetical protein